MTILSTIDGLGARSIAAADTVANHWITIGEWLIERPRLQKRMALVLIDFVLLSVVLLAALAARYGVRPQVPANLAQVTLIASAPIITVATFGWLGLYKLVTRYIGSRGTTRILLSIALAVLIWSALVLMTGQSVPRSVILAYGLLSALVIWASRMAIASMLATAGISVPTSFTDNKRVLIYGAGAEGQQMRAALYKKGYDVIGFLDHSPTLWGQYIGRTKVYPPDRLDHFIAGCRVDEVLIASSITRRQERREILKELEGKPVALRIMPAMEDIAAGRVAVTDLRPVDVADLLGRDPVPPVADLLTRNIVGQSIMVTGAGGSVGSELVRQVLQHGPARLVLLDVSEVALYEIHSEVTDRIRTMPLGAARPVVVPVLGSVLDAALLGRTLERHEVDVIYHAAAYKHVPMVEDNIAVGIANNTLGTWTMAEAARAHGVKRMVLISTDKAVRPTNVMGATKRLAELVLQAMAGEDGGTVFSMVRFGNVLGSSGSVVRRFRQQIQAGGPVTVTHPEINRYFMSIPEAAELVIQAGAMAKGGEVFVLDMGEPVRILDLARMMIQLSGFEVRDGDNPDGDIAIAFTGLRPGEKLYEELLIAANPRTTATEHSRIMRAHEPMLPDTWQQLEALRSAIVAGDTRAMLAILERNVEGYVPSAHAVFS